MTQSYAFALAALALFVTGILFERARIPWLRRQWRAKHKNGRWQARRRTARAPNDAPSLRIVSTAPDAPRDAADQLRIVMQSEFEQRPLLSKQEARVLYKAEEAIKGVRPNWRVMAQVCLGEVLRSPDPAAHACINSKRCDLLIISSKGLPVAAIEYQGGGHYQGSAAARDAVKKEALRKAGVRYFEVTPEDDLSELKREILRLAELEQTKTITTDA